MFAGGIERAGGEGMAEYRAMMADYLRGYLGACRWLGVERNLEMLAPQIAQYLPEDLRPAAAGEETAHA